jgi:predicted TIM-barrel fold metal-dependent hydrolase
MVVTLEEKQAQSGTKYSFIDCDIHNALPSEATLRSYLPQRWRRHHETFAMRQFPGNYLSHTNPLACRADAWPPSGGPPGSDLDFMRAQLLDAWGIEYGILNPMPLIRGERNLEYAAALASAVNDWQIDEWLDKEPRLRASLAIAHEDGDLAAAEIDRLGSHSGFVQVMFLARTSEPLGRRKYWKIYDAATRHDLPVAIHVGGRGGGPITGAGWPSFYFEHHVALALDYQTQLISLICEGVFEKFPTLKIVLIEPGFGWLPALMWRLDRSWRRLGDELPHVSGLPSDYIRKHVWITTQPIEEPAKPDYFYQVLDQLGMSDRLVFSTDYPHWDFDAPDMALPLRLPDDVKRRIMADNARSLYRF